MGILYFPHFYMLVYICPSGSLCMYTSWNHGKKKCFYVSGPMAFKRPVCNQIFFCLVRYNTKIMLVHFFFFILSVFSSGQGGNQVSPLFSTNYPFLVFSSSHLLRNIGTSTISLFTKSYWISMFTVSLITIPEFTIMAGHTTNPLILEPKMPTHWLHLQLKQWLRKVELILNSFWVLLWWGEKKLWLQIEGEWNWMDFDLLVVSILERGKEIGNKNEV